MSDSADHPGRPGGIEGAAAVSTAGPETAVDTAPAQAVAAIAKPSLWRNRAFVLLFTGQAVSDLGSSMSRLAMPLLTLALTGSPILAGVVGTVAAVVRLIAQLPAGVLADRVDRRRLMLVSDAVRFVAYAALAIVVITESATVVWIVAVGVIDAVFQVVHELAQFGAVRNVVSVDRVGEATARNEARASAVSLIGPPVGGVLYAVTRSLPFFADAVSYLISFLAIRAIRTPLQEDRTEPAAAPTAELVEGIRFTLTEPFLRAVLFIAAPINLAFNGVLFAVIVILQRHGTAPGLIGTVEAIFAGGILVGALVAPKLATRIPLRQLAMTITWSGVALFAIASTISASVIVGIPLALAVMLGPAANAALFGYLATVTPDRLQGRVTSVIFVTAMSLAGLSALAGGVLVEAWGDQIAVLAFAAIMALAAIAATVSKGLRQAH